MQLSTNSPPVTITVPGPNGITQTIVGPASSGRLAELLARRAEMSARLAQIDARRKELTARIDARRPPAELSKLTSDLQSLNVDAGTLQSQLTAIDRAINANSIAVTQAPTQPFPARVVTSLATIGVLFVVLLPISIAMATRLWRRPASRSTNQISPQVEERLNRLEHGIDAIAIEMERVSEGQRYVTKLLSSDKISEKVER